MSFLKLFTINAVFAFLLAEGLAFFANDFLQSQFFHNASDPIEHRMQHLEAESSQRPHPYFGYIGPKDSSFETAENYLKEPSENVFRLGVFGGSVASQFFRHIQGDKTFIEDLKKHSTIGDKKIELVNFSMNGYRQPQSLHIFQMYGASLDFALTVDGHNELAYFFSGDFPDYYPLHLMTRLYFSEHPAYQFIQEADSHYQRKKTHWKKAREMNWPWGLKFFHLAKARYHQRWLSEWHSRDFPYRRPFVRPENHDDVNERLRLWLRSACLQQNAGVHMGVGTAFVFQPLPAHPDLSYPEHSADDYTFKQVLQKSMSRISHLDLYGINYYDSHKDFKNLPRDPFIDDCCHLNSYGLDILKRIALEQLSKTQSQKNIFCDWQGLNKAYSVDSSPPKRR